MHSPDDSVRKRLRNIRYPKRECKEGLEVYHRRIMKLKEKELMQDFLEDSEDDKDAE